MSEIREQCRAAAEELVAAAGLKRGQIVVVGCSTSEVCGSRIGTDSRPEVAAEIVDGILSVLEEKGIYLAAQCCEHLNRALIVERAAVPSAEPVNVIPQPKAGVPLPPPFMKGWRIRWPWRKSGRMPGLTSAGP